MPEFCWPLISVNATWLPSGENAGPTSYPAKPANGMTSGAGRGVSLRFLEEARVLIAARPNSSKTAASATQVRRLIHHERGAAVSATLGGGSGSACLVHRSSVHPR